MADGLAGNLDSVEDFRIGRHCYTILGSSLHIKLVKLYFDTKIKSIILIKIEEYNY